MQNKCSNSCDQTNRSGLSGLAAAGATV